MPILANKRIFVVEDNSDNRVITQISLGMEGATLHFDFWGRDTLRKLSTFMPVDLIIMDLMLSAGTDGFSVTKEIRAMPEFRDIPIIAVSASDPSTAIPQCRRQGFIGFIAKPISDDFPKQLVQILNGTPVWDDGS